MVDAQVRGTSSSRATAAAAAVTVACVLPVFLTGGMAVQMAADLGFSVSALGVAMASFVAAQAALSRFFGRWADRVGAPMALRIASGAGATSALAIALVVRNWSGLSIALAVAGLANALGQPSASRLLARSVRRDRQGIAFGIFQSSKPVAGLLGGLAVPAIALTVGWRWAFVASAALSLTAVWLVPRWEAQPVEASAAAPRTSLPPGVVAVLIAGMALGFGAVKVFGTFLVDAAVHAGISPAAAGLLLAGGSGLAIATRLSVGVVADRREGGHLGAVAVMLLVGSVGFALLAAQQPLMMIFGTMFVAGGAWGYNGLFYLSMTRLLRDSPAAITGVMLAGSSVGGVIGPVVFGVVADRYSYSWAWPLVALWTVLAAGAIGRAAWMLRRRDIGRTGPADGPRIPYTRRAERRGPLSQSRDRTP